ncbi:MAG: hypothetical protein P9M14_07965 [Candidatus Alcyoniella australis]|nr:hypothetical protein [Candidatus Alcyoniella australis]
MKTLVVRVKGHSTIRWAPALVALVFLWGAAPAFAATGGPDTFGYTWSDECAYEWTDTSLATEVELPDDGYEGPLPMGFSFLFYAELYQQFYIGSNGIISFEQGVNTEFNQCPLPNAAEPNNLIAAVWDDLDPSSAGKVSYEVMGEDPGRKLIISYEDVPFYGTSDLVSVQLILYEPGNRIRIQVQTTGGAQGAASTTGIEGPQGVSGLSYACNSAGSIPDSTCVEFSYPSSISVLPDLFHGNARSGQTVSYDVRLQNLTGVAEDFELSFDGADWPTSVDSEQVQLPEGEQRTVTIEVQIPADALLWSLDKSTLQVQGLNSGQSAQAEVVTIFSDQWVDASSLLRPRQDHCVAAVDDKLYVIGHNSFVSGVEGTVEVLSLERRGSWSSGPEMPVPVALADAAVIEGRIMIPGGFDGEGLLPTLFVFDTADDDWSESTPAPAARYAYEAVVDGGLLYMIGGRGLDRTSTDTLFSYDPERDVWSALASMNVPRAFHYAWARDGLIYVAGGLDTSETMLSSSEVYDVDADAWFDLEMADLPQPLWGGGSVVQNGQLLLIGGMNFEGPTGSALTYDSIENLWIEIPGLETPRFRFDAALLGDWIFAPGGMVDSSGTPTDVVEAVALTGDDDDDDEPHSEDAWDDSSGDDDDDDHCGCGC